MTDDIPLDIPEAEDADVDALYALIAAGLDYEALLLRVGRPVEPAARVRDLVRGRQS